MTSGMSGETIAELTRTIWSGIVGESEVLEPAENVGHGDVTGSVSISGTWNGRFLICFTPKGARQAAARMFSCAEEDLSDGDVHDAVGEIANIIGGNLKALLPPPASLSLPVVTNSERIGSDDAEVVSEMHFAWLSEPVVVAVRQAAVATAASVLPG